MKTIFDSDDTVSEVAIAVESLARWLSEQPAQPLRRGVAHFTYEADGRLREVTVTLDEVEK